MTDAAFPEFVPADRTALDFAAEEADRAMFKAATQAVRRRRGFLAFQPVVQAADPGRVAFWEGLIRLEDLDGKVLPASSFMPVAEAHDLGRRIDILSLELGLLALREEPSLRLSINMSARSIGYPQWLRMLETGIADDPTIAERLILEITESSAMLLPEVVRQFMSNMRRHGVSFALDDFGAGYTAFRYLKDFTFDIVKIDGMFIRNVATDPDNQVLTQALVMIARQFDMFTVAEAVETEAEAAWLKQCGVDCLQGYRFGAPMAVPPWRNERQPLRAAG